VTSHDLDPSMESLRAEVKQALAAPPRAHAATPKGRPITSDLSIDEALLIHSIGWEPIDLIFGASVMSVPSGVWVWGQGELTPASSAHNSAMAAAARRMETQCRAAGGQGAVGVRVNVEITPHHIDVELTGTAVRAVDSAAKPVTPFISDLSARDFVLLHTAGWAPIGLAFGASFVYAPRRTTGTALKQSSQNIELVNYTEAMYAARESAMERMQQSALGVSANGIVAVHVGEGPVSFARHVIGFTAWGTAVTLVAKAHTHRRPQVVLPLDDSVIQFSAESLRRTEP
jgi:uncharacterized protein YbjQ (UPF0145 family)